METVKVLAPDYYSEFHCIGSECPYNCCSDWGEISIDKETYKKYKDFPNAEFNKKMHAAFKPVKEPNGKINPGRAAVVVLDKRGACPFFTEDKLCEIQQKMGYQYLCNTCKHYPRQNIRDIKPSLETDLTLSCIQVARLALFRGDKIKFAKADIDAKYVKKRTSAASYGGALKEHVREIRQSCIEMMQNEELPILQRIYSIAHFLQGVESSLSKTEDGERKINLNMDAKQIFSAIIKKNMQFKEYVILAADIIKDAFGEDKMYEVSDDEVHRHITENSQEQWDNLLKGRAIMLENYFVSFIFQKVFPFCHEGLGMFHHSYLLWERYEMLRFFLGVVAIKFKADEIKDADIARCVSKIEKYFSHEKSEVSVKRVQNYVK